MDLNSQTRAQLMEIAKEMSVDVKSTDNKDVMIDKIQNASLAKLDATVETNQAVAPTDGAESDSLVAVAEEPAPLEKTDPLGEPLVEVVVPQVNTNQIAVGAPLTPKEPKTADGFPVSQVIDEANAAMGGRARARWNKNNPMVIELRGGPRKAWDLAINQQKNYILRLSQQFCSRAFTDARDIGRMEGQAEQSMFAKNPDDMSPAEIAQAQEFLQKIMGNNAA